MYTRYQITCEDLLNKLKTKVKKKHHKVYLQIRFLNIFSIVDYGMFEEITTQPLRHFKWSQDGYFLT